eukprot:1151715-Pelagomonas_calceolata.AAC.1
MMIGLHCSMLLEEAGFLRWNWTSQALMLVCELLISGYPTCSATPHNARFPHNTRVGTQALVPRRAGKTEFSQESTEPSVNN